MRLRSARALMVVLVALMITWTGVSCGSGGSETAEGLPEAPSGKAEAAGFDGVHSGELELTLEIDRYKKKPEEINMRILGNFRGAGEEGLEFNLGLGSHGLLDGTEVDFNGGLALGDNRAVVAYGPTRGEQTYQIDGAAFEDLKSGFAEELGGGGEGDPGACLEAAGDFSYTEVLDHFSYEGESETLDERPLEIVGADLDVPAAIDELIALSETPSCKAQLEALGLPSRAELKDLEKELQHSLTAARVTLGINRKGVVRFFKVLTNAELPRNEELEVELVMRLNLVNEVTELPPLYGYKSLEALLKQFGTDLKAAEGADDADRFLAFLEASSDGVFGTAP